METTETDSQLEDILRELKEREQLDSLHYLVQKLPEFTHTIRSIDDKLSFVNDVINDQQSMNTVGREVDEKIDKLHLNQEHFDALLEMVQLMPSLVPMMKKLDDVTLFVNEFLSDTTSVEYALKGLNDIVPIEKGLEVIHETNNRFNRDGDTTNVSILSMYRLLKDPVMQKGFKYMETLLDVVKEK
ncbi:hypothetical protein GCM10009001_06640 [Virgibacillus siamensis]|uniref:DUF1641 domain-containing protein n=1 Tax=Virgibacillus siamensis TaxID=480071 RepID=A0ABP3QTC9_9BACI